MPVNQPGGTTVVAMRIRPAPPTDVLAWSQEAVVDAAARLRGQGEAPSDLLRDRAVAAVLAAVVLAQAQARDLAATAATQATVEAMLGAAGTGAPVEVPYRIAVASPTAAGAIHEAMHDRVLDDDGELLAPDGSRKAKGAYYTPAEVVEVLLDHALDPVLERTPHAEVARLRICDPACGGGNFLVPVLERVATRLEDAGYRPDRARRTAAECLVGIDVDPVAVVLARLALWLAVGDSRLSPVAFDRRIRLGDALFGTGLRDVTTLHESAFEAGPDDERPVATTWRKAWQAALAVTPDLVDRALVRDPKGTLDALTATWEAPKVDGAPQVLPVIEALAAGEDEPGDSAAVVREIVARRRPLHWAIDVPEALDGFDVVVGNPPYVKSRAHGRTHPALRRRLTRTRPECRGGQWNLYVPFVALAADLVRPGGRSALLVPNSVLAADFAAPLHEHLEGRVATVLDFTRADLFEDAAVHVASLVTTAEADPAGPVEFVVHDAHLEPLRRRDVGRDLLHRLPPGYWCLPLLAADLEVGEDVLLDLLAMPTTIGDVATVRDGASTKEAYELKPLLREWDDDPDAEVVRFANTGTIDPDRFLWGERDATYLGRKYRRPVLDVTELGSSFPKRLAEARSPKVLLAGLSSTLEAVADPEGRWLCGKSAVQVLVDDPAQAEAMAAWLNRPELSALYRALFGLAGFGGQGMNVAPALVARLPAPDGW